MKVTLVHGTFKAGRLVVELADFSVSGEDKNILKPTIETYKTKTIIAHLCQHLIRPECISTNNSYTYSNR